MDSTDRHSINDTINGGQEIVLESYKPIKSPGSHSKSSDAMMCDDGALRPGGAPKILSKECAGILCQYAVVGLYYGVLPKTLLPFLTYYLNAEGMTTVSAIALFDLPWAFKAFYGMLTDNVPIFGYRRRPYMILGWIIASITLLAIVFKPMPPPYFPDPSWRDVKPDNYTEEMKAKINFSTQNQAGYYIILMSISTFAFVLSDCAADALVVEYSQREPLAVRGRLQSAVYATRTFFVGLADILIGFGLNTPDYGGDFSHGLSYTHVVLIIALSSIFVIPVTWFYISEEVFYATDFQQYIQMMWDILQTRVFYQIMGYLFISSILTRVEYVSYYPIISYWIKATPMHVCIATIVSNVTFSFTILCIGRYCLNMNWRTTTVVSLLLQAMITLAYLIPIAYNLTRSETFWLTVQVLENFPIAFWFMVGCFVVVEVAGKGNEGVTVGMLNTVQNLGNPIASTLEKKIDGGFSVWNSDLLNDSSKTRRDVTITVVIACCFKLSAIAFIGLLPRQKAETQRIRAKGETSKLMGAITITYFMAGILWSLLNNLLSMFSSTKCLSMLGGCRQ